VKLLIYLKGMGIKMENEFTEILQSYIISMWKLFLIPILIIVIAAIVKFVKNKKSQRSIKDYLLIIFLFWGFIVCGCAHTVPAMIDLKQESVETTDFESAYYYNQSVINDNAMLGLKPILVCRTDGTEIELQDSTFDFPFEVEDGTITYAKHSKIILEYSGTVINENHF